MLNSHLTVTHLLKSKFRITQIQAPNFVIEFRRLLVGEKGDDNERKKREKRRKPWNKKKKFLRTIGFLCTR